MDGVKINSKEQLIDEIADAIQQHFDELELFLDLTDQEVISLPCRYGYDDEEDSYEEDDDVVDSITGTPISKLREKRSHDLEQIYPVYSSDGFRIMEDFAGQKENENLFRALRQRHPFRAFQDAANREGLLREWYAYKNKTYNALAEDWLKDNDIDFVDGKVVRVEES